MRDTLRQMAGIRAANRINAYLYYLKRLPLVGKRIPDRLYGAIRAKQALTVAATLFHLLSSWVGKALYVVLFILAPAYYLTQGQPDGAWLRASTHLLIVLSFGVGGLRQSTLLENSQDKYLCVKLLHMDARRYHLGALLNHQATDAWGFLPAVLIGWMAMGASWQQALGLYVGMMAWRTAMEAVHLWLYDHTGRLFFKYGALIIPAILLGWVGAYLPVMLGSSLPLAGLLRHLWISPLLVALAALAVGYMARYPRYRQCVKDTTLREQLSFDTQKAVNEARFSDVQLKDQDFAGEWTAERAGRLTGYAYLNALFFERHRRLIWRPVFRQLAVLGVVLALEAMLSVALPSAMQALALHIPQMLPAFVFVMYALSNGQRVCKAMFYNCDISLLRYAFYRNRRVILLNFRLRLRRIAGLNLLVAVAICACLAVPLLLTGIPWQWGVHGTLLLSILGLSLFFSVHHLFLYYVFQPYTTELGMKNPVFSVLNQGVYLLCFACLYIDTVPTFFSLMVLAATAGYVLLALWAVYRWAPKAFRVK